MTRQKSNANKVCPTGRLCFGAGLVRTHRGRPLWCERRRPGLRATPAPITKDRRGTFFSFFWLSTVISCVSARPCWCSVQSRGLKEEALSASSRPYTSTGIHILGGGGWGRGGKVKSDRRRRKEAEKCNQAQTLKGKRGAVRGREEIGRETEADTTKRVRRRSLTRILCEQKTCSS